MSTEAMKAEREADAKAEIEATPRTFAEDAEHGSQTTVTSYEILLERSNQEKIGMDAMSWEIPILQAIHGEQAVTILNEFDEDIVADPEFVFRNLKARYNRKDSGNSDIVERVWGFDAQKLAGEMGVKYSKPTVTEKRPESVNVDNRPGKKTAKKK